MRQSQALPAGPPKKKISSRARGGKALCAFFALSLRFLCFLWGDRASSFWRFSSALVLQRSSVCGACASDATCATCATCATYDATCATCDATYATRTVTSGPSGCGPSKTAPSVSASSGIASASSASSDSSASSGIASASGTSRTCVSASAEIGNASASRCVDASVCRTQPGRPHYQNLLRLDPFLCYFFLARESSFFF